VIERFEKFMADWDVIVIPPSALLVTTNLTGNPQVVMKCGFVDDTLQDGSKIKFPRSISFLGRIYDERSPLRVAMAYEQAMQWRKMNPVLMA
jgi:Asp-tRNA(Asn)/Glu-tRNA(Gln) amidotransferase A subunit family amidase